MDKDEMRQQMLARRKTIDQEQVDRMSRAIMERLISTVEYGRAGSLMIYVDFRNEVRTGELIAHALNAGKRVSVPVTHVKDKKLTPSSILSYPGDLEPGTWGIMEPRQSCFRPLDPGELDMVIVPGVAYDLQGNRLGYGGGFYDRFLPRTRPGTVFLAPAFEMQIVDNAFPGCYDVPVHIIVTEKRIINLGAKGV
ncbi:MAG: 5-formyltetrahydrofolate cyclo-ligase [Bacillota bacterium]